MVDDGANVQDLRLSTLVVSTLCVASVQATLVCAAGRSSLISFSQELRLTVVLGPPTLKSTPRPSLVNLLSFLSTAQEILLLHTSEAWLCSCFTFVVVVVERPSATLICMGTIMGLMQFELQVAVVFSIARCPVVVWTRHCFSTLKQSYISQCRAFAAAV